MYKFNDLQSRVMRVVLTRVKIVIPFKFNYKWKLIAKTKVSVYVSIPGLVSQGTHNLNVI